jgi:hypothetical protein
MVLFAFAVAARLQNRGGWGGKQQNDTQHQVISNNKNQKQRQGLKHKEQRGVSKDDVENPIPNAIAPGSGRWELGTGFSWCLVHSDLSWL